MGSRKQLGKNIRIARNKLGLHRTSAYKAGVHTNYYARAERAKKHCL